MLGQRLGTLDKTMLMVSLCGAALFGFILWDENFVVRHFMREQRGERRIGEIIFAKNDVRRRMNQSLTWYQASENENVFERDSIFTGADSEIEIKVGDEQGFSLGANSMVVLQSKDNEILFDLQLGSIAAQSSGEQTIKVMHAGQLTEIKADMKAAPVHIRKSESGQLSVLSQTGDVEVAVQGRKTRARKNEALSVEKDLKVKKETYPVKFSSHKISEKMWRSAEEKIEFKWRNEEPQTPVKLQIARSSQFEKYVLDAPAPNDGLTWAPQDTEGTYFYRVVRAADGQPLSPMQMLDLYLKKPVELVFPHHKARLYSLEILRKNETRAVSFQWEGRRGISQYQLEISLTADFSDSFRSEIYKSDHADLDLTQGNYYWRVRPKGSPADSFVSETREFSLGSEEQPLEIPLRVHGPERPPSEFKPERPPQVSNMTQEVVLKFKADVDVRSPASIERSLLNPPLLKWEPLPGATDYAIEIDGSEKFESPLIFDPVSDPGFAWKDPKPGRYYWRVKGRDEAGRASVFSPPTELKVRLSAPELEPIPAENQMTKDVAELTRKKIVKAKWKKIPLAAGYRVIAGERSVVTKTGEFNLEVTPNQTTEIKVAAVDTKGRLVSDFAKQKVNYEMKLLLTSPDIILPKDKTTIVAFGKVNMDPLLFNWKAVTDVKEYELQFAKDTEFKNILYEQTVSKNSFILKNKLTDGIVFWRVRSRFETNVSDWSKPRSYELQASE